jgi:hypothetical protein
VAVIVAALACAALAAPAAGAANKFPFPDKSLNGTGSVDLTPLLSNPALSGRTLSYAPAPSGAVWIGSSRQTCGFSYCFSSYVSRVGSNGGLVTALGEGGSLGYTGAARAQSTVVSDPQGRAITVTPEKAGEITVRRFLPSGAPDTSFGSGGATTVDCTCLAETAETPRIGFDSEGRIVIGIPIYSGFPTTGYDSVVRLLANGSLDSSFGSGGIIRSTAVTYGQFVSPGGALFLAGGEGQFGERAALERYTNKGVADTAFDSKANAVLTKVQQERSGGAQSFQVVGMRFRADGVVDVILNEVGGSTVVRLRSDGSAEAKFAKDGVRALGRNISQAIPGGNGDTIALTRSFGHARGEELSRFLPNYKIDPSFATKGALVIPGLGEEGSGLSIAAASKGRVTILDKGLRFCRYTACGPEPKLLRYRVGPVK